MAMSEVKEPPPKPTRIRTSSTVKSSEQSIASVGIMINGQQSPIPNSSTSTPRPNYRTFTQGVNSSSTNTEVQLGVSTERGEREFDIASRRNFTSTGANPKTLATAKATTNQLASGNNIPIINNNSDVALSRTKAPAPPPKPKRISAPQPKAKPLSLQSTPIQIKDITQSVNSITTPVAPSSQPSILPTTPTRTSNVIQQSYSPSKSISLSVLSPSPSHSIPPPKKPRSTENSMDGSLSHMESMSGHQRLRNQSIAPSSSPPPLMSKSHPNIGIRTQTDISTLDKRIDPPAGANPTLVGARSRLRSTSDAKASTSLAVAVSQTTRTLSTKATTIDDNDGFSFIEHSKGHFSPLVSPTLAPSHPGRSGFYDEDAEDTSSVAAGERLAASLQKIQARAQEQSERMKQINYSEKRSDLAEVMYEKSNLWRARGAEWGGIAKKAWEDRGGVGGITGGLADRWKKRGDSGNDNMSEYPRSAPVAQIFGLPLVEAVKISKISAKTGVPAIVSRCIEYLDIMGVEEVGLYRVSGSTTNVARLKATFDSGNDHDFLQKGNEPQNPHDVAALLKLYLRELPSPIITLDLVSSFNAIDFSDSKHHTTQKLKDTLHSLPLENYILLGTLCRHLSNLADYESCTKMNISNLGLIFCPTLQIGSVLFKNLLGGDGDDDERRRTLQMIWADLDKKHEELENIEMIRQFEECVQVEKQTSYTSSGAKVREYSNNSRNFNKENDDSRQSWEEIDRELIDFSPSPTQQQQNTTAAYFSKNISSGLMSNFTPTATTKPEQSLDLYDELMTREINEATSTPLIDLDFDDMSQQGGRYRRHAREPAINQRSSSPPPTSVNTTRHERFPAMSARY